MKRIVLLVVLLLICTVGTSMAAAPISFGITAAKTKVGDGSSSWIPTYGPGKHMAVDGSVVYVVHTRDNVFGEVEIVLVKSFDDGLTWEASDVIAHSSAYNGNGAAMAIAPDPNNGAQKIIHIIWGTQNATPNTVYYSRCTVDAAGNKVGGWSAPLAITGPTVQGGYEARSIAVDNSGLNVHVVFKGLNGTGGIFYSSSNDGGLTFAEMGTQLSSDSGDEPNVAIDASGNVYVAWSAYGGAQTDIFFRKKMGVVWNPTVKVNTNYAGSFCTLAVFDGNRIYIAWPSPIGGIVVAGTANGGNNTYDWLEHVVSTGWSDRPDIVVDSTGTLNLAWINQGVLFSRSKDNGYTWTNPTSVDSVADFDPKMSVNGAGMVYMIFPGKNWGTVNFTKEK